MLNFLRVPSFFANFTIGMIGNETGHLVKCVKLYRKININETKHVLRRNIAATSLKISCKSLYSVKRYDETNMKVFALSLWEKFSWGLTYFDEFYFNFTWNAFSLTYNICMRKIWFVQESRGPIC